MQQYFFYTGIGIPVLIYFKFLQNYWADFYRNRTSNFPTKLYWDIVEIWSQDLKIMQKKLHNF